MNPLSSIGTGELILVLVIALIFLGPERLPEIARSAGKTFRQFRDALQRMSSDFGEELASVQSVTKDLQEGMQAVHQVRNLPRTLVTTAAAPLVKGVEPVKKTLEEAGSVAAQSVSSVAGEVQRMGADVLSPASTLAPDASESPSADQAQVEDTATQDNDAR
ncbi:MAG: Sec-independent protein translocase protein TatB [Chloroflexota bacterium]